MKKIANKLFDVISFAIVFWPITIAIIAILLSFAPKSFYVYYVPDGECYHKTKRCETLEYSTTIIKAEPKDVPYGRRPCSVCKPDEKKYKKNRLSNPIIQEIPGNSDSPLYATVYFTNDDYCYHLDLECEEMIRDEIIYKAPLNVVKGLYPCDMCVPHSE